MDNPLCQSILADVRDYWTADTLADAQRLVGEKAEYWKDTTPHQLSYFLTPVVLAEIPRLESRTALEIGCGVGRILFHLAPLFQRVIGVDISPSMVSFAAKELCDIPNVEVIECDGQSLPLPDNSADFVLSFIVLQHIPSREVIRRYIAESLRVLKSGGIVRMQTCCGRPSERFNGVHGYYYPSLAEFSSEFGGFEILEAQEGCMCCGFLWITGRKN